MHFSHRASFLLALEGSLDSGHWAELIGRGAFVLGLYETKCCIGPFRNGLGNAKLRKLLSKFPVMTFALSVIGPQALLT